ncbi:MAG: ribosomal protein S18-alanine N-acetyltransferase [Clostridia bacterium]|nr:ribosomal protein S18-alanine N-acetyltransferase [Clostridia bacterium]
MNEPQTVIRLSREHLAQVSALERLCFSEPWSENALELLLGDAAIGFVCVAGSHVVAYGGMLWAPDEGQITNVAVHPNARRRGCARAILSALTEAARARGALQISLEVRESNAAAIALYERDGYKTVGKRKNFYRNPREDALIMIRNI